MKVVLDTNVWLSGIFWGGKPGFIVDLIVSDKAKIEPCFSEATLTELKEKLNKRASYKLIPGIREIGRVVSVLPSKAIIVRDPKDQMWVDLCMTDKPEFLVTGDKDLLVLKKIGETVILTPNDFVLMFIK